MRKHSKKSAKSPPAKQGSNAPNKTVTRTDAWHQDMARIAQQGRKEDLAPRYASQSPTGHTGQKLGQPPPISTPRGDKPKEDKATAPKPKQEKPEILYFTSLKPKSGSKKRTKVGVGEKVVFKGNMKGNWEVSNGTPKAALDTKKYKWVAPDRADTVTIKFTVGDETATINFTVVEPDSIETSRAHKIPITPGTAGAGMSVHFDYLPFDVSFGNVSAGEVSGPASGLDGYFKDNFAPGDLWHNSGDGFTQIKSNNRDSVLDTAKGEGFPQPWKKGEFHWVIPNRFKLDGETGNGKVFTNVRQSFEIDAQGTVTVTKGLAKVTRKVNEA